MHKTQLEGRSFSTLAWHVCIQQIKLIRPLSLSARFWGKRFQNHSFNFEVGANGQFGHMVLF